MKKTILTIGLLIGALVGNAQCEYSKNEVDEFTGATKKFLKFKEVANNEHGKLYISLKYLDGAFMTVGFTGDIGCAASDSKIMIKLLNGEIITLKNFGDINCGDTPAMLFDIGVTDKEFLYNSPVEKIRLYGSDSYTDLTPKNKDFFIENLPCIEK